MSKVLSSLFSIICKSSCQAIDYETKKPSIFSPLLPIQYPEPQTKGAQNGKLSRSSKAFDRGIDLDADRPRPAGELPAAVSAESS